MCSLNADPVREKIHGCQEASLGELAGAKALLAVDVIFLCMRYMLNFQETFQFYINYCCIVAVSIFF